MTRPCYPPFYSLTDYAVLIERQLDEEDSETMSVWVVTLINDQLDVIGDEVTYDESAVSRIAQEMNDIAKPTEQVLIWEGRLALPSDMKES